MMVSFLPQFVSGMVSFLVLRDVQCNDRARGAVRVGFYVPHELLILLSARFTAGDRRKQDRITRVGLDLGSVCGRRAVRPFNFRVMDGFCIGRNRHWFTSTGRLARGSSAVPFQGWRCQTSSRAQHRSCSGPKLRQGHAFVTRAELVVSTPDVGFVWQLLRGTVTRRFADTQCGRSLLGLWRLEKLLEVAVL